MRKKNNPSDVTLTQNTGLDYSMYKWVDMFEVLRMLPIINRRHMWNLRIICVL